MMTALDAVIVYARHGRVIALASNAPADRVRALRVMGYDPETARVFGFTGGERSAVMQLAKRKGVIV